MTQSKLQPAMHQPDIRTLGEGALVLNAGSSATLDCQQRLWAIASEASDWLQIRDVVPGMNNLTILFDPLLANTDDLAGKLLSAWNKATAVSKSGRQIDIPVIYGGDCGPDLTVVAEHTGLSIAE